MRLVNSTFQIIVAVFAIWLINGAQLFAQEVQTSYGWESYGVPPDQLIALVGGKTLFDRSLSRQ